MFVIHGTVKRNLLIRKIKDLKYFQNFGFPLEEKCRSRYFKRPPSKATMLKMTLVFLKGMDDAAKIHEKNFVDQVYMIFFTVMICVT